MKHNNFLKNDKLNKMLLPTLALSILAISSTFFIASCGKKDTKCVLEVSTTNGTVNGGQSLRSSYTAGSDVQLTFAPSIDHVLPDDINVNANERRLIINQDYQYNKTTGEFSFKISNNTTIDMIATLKTYGDITITLKNPGKDFGFGFNYTGNFPGSVDWGDGTDIDHDTKHIYKGDSSLPIHTITIKDYRDDCFSLYEEDEDEYGGFIYVTSIKLSNTIITLSDYAFASCTSLASIELPESLKIIGKSAFENASALTNIAIPDSVTSINNHAFKNSSALEEVKINNTSHLASIGDGVFANCYALNKITIPNSVISLGYEAFRYCENLEYNHTSDDTKTCYLGNIDNPYLVLATTIEDDEKTNLKIADGCRFVMDSAINYPSLTSVLVSNTVTIINKYAFYGCSSLTNIDINENCKLTTIGEFAFGLCSALTNLTAPKDLQNIDDYAFYDCNISDFDLSKVNNVVKCGIEIFGDKKNIGQIIVPSHLIDRYKSAACWEIYKDKIVSHE